MDKAIVTLLSELRMMAEMEKDLTPSRVVLRLRGSLIVEAVQTRRLFEGSSVGEAKQNDITYIAGLKHYSKEPIHNLSCVRFREMIIPMAHKGKYVLCRTISLPVTARVFTVDVTVEDPSGDALPLTIFNFPLPLFSNAQELDDIFPIGTLLAIREPYMKPFFLDCSRPLIQVDSPTDIIFLDSQSNLLQDVIWKFPTLGPQRPPNVAALECKLDGNQKFKGNRWLSAALAYTKGLSLSPSHGLYTILRLNRSEAYLKLGYLPAALADAQLVLSDKALPQGSIMLGKALLKAGKANYFQDKFKEALGCFMQLRNISEGIAEAETWIGKTHLRIAEQNHGDYDWYKIFKDSQVVGSRVDVADYIGPIEVRDLRSYGHGRGVVASRDISPGELLLVCKPFVSAFRNEFPEKTQLFGLTPPPERFATTSQVALMHKCIQKLYGNPSMKNLVCDLYASSYAPSPSYPPHTGSDILHEPLRTSIDIDVSRVESICLGNMFSPAPLGYAESIPDSRDGPSALYLFPSMFNHSCWQNAHLSFLQDVMVVRARSKIFKGQEVFITYIDLDTYAKRTEVLKRWALTCQCQLCQDDHEEGADALATRERLESGLDDPVVTANVTSIIQLRANIIELEDKIKQVRKTYAASRRSPKVSLAHMHHHLAWQFQNLGKATNQSTHYYRAIDELFEALKALGIQITDDSVQGNIPQSRNDTPIDKENFNVLEPERAIGMIILFGLIPCFVALGDKIRGERWLRAACLIHDITIGGGRTLFEERYKLFYQHSFIRELSITSRPDEE